MLATQQKQASKQLHLGLNTVIQLEREIADFLTAVDAPVATGAVKPASELPLTRTNVNLVLQLFAHQVGDEAFQKLQAKLPEEHAQMIEMLKNRQTISTINSAFDQGRAYKTADQLITATQTMMKEHASDDFSKTPLGRLVAVAAKLR